jgi:hypothetical protein
MDISMIEQFIREGKYKEAETILLKIVSDSEAEGDSQRWRDVIPEVPSAG